MKLHTNYRTHLMVPEKESLFQLPCMWQKSKNLQEQHHHLHLHRWVFNISIVDKFQLPRVILLIKVKQE